jgi:hypothetical protein
MVEWTAVKMVDKTVESSVDYLVALLVGNLGEMKVATTAEMTAAM